jgi:hypothetical protein
MNFLAPLFAIGVLGVAIPILVHLVHKERKETTPFPSLMFLLRTPYQHSRRQRIRDWLLFLMRAAVFLLIVAAFARPVFDRPGAIEAAAASGGRELVILLDRSFSMRVGGRWSRAQDAARQALDGLEASGRGTVVLFDDQARAVSEDGGSRAVLRAAIDSARPGDASTRYAPAMLLARRVVTESRLPNREVMVISDFQRSGWDLGEESRLPAGVTVTPIDVATPDVRDRAVRAVELRRSADGARERVTVIGRISNAGPAVRGLRAELEVAGRVVATSRVDLAADAGGVVTFEAQAVPETPQRALIRIDRDDVPEDDVLHFVMERAPSIPVLVVEAVTPGVDRDVFLERAMEIGERPTFDVTVRRATQLAASDFVGKRLVVLNDVPHPAGEVGRRLEAFVRGGGGLIIAQGEGTTTRTWAGQAGALLPAAPGDVRDRMSDKGAVVGYIDRSHPALALFGATGGVDLSGARFYRYRPIAVDSGVLMRLDDGAVALAEHSVGTGRVMVFASSFDGNWNDLPRQLVFLPFVHQVAQYASGYRAGRNVYEVGDAVDLQLAARDSASAGLQFVALAPSGARLRIGGSLGEPALIPAEAGVYEVRRAGAPGERPRLVAVNVPGRELDLARFDPTRLTNTAMAPEGAVPAAAEGQEPDLATREREQSVWWYLLLFAAALLVSESVLAHRLTRGRLAASPGG